MFDGLSLTDYLALMFGVYLIAAGLGLFFEGEAYNDMIDVFRDNAALGYIAGVMAFVVGVVIVRIHNDWSSLEAIIVSLVGWFSLIEGVLILAFRRPFLAAVGKIGFSGPMLAGFAIFCFLLGGVLLFQVLL